MRRNALAAAIAIAWAIAPWRPAAACGTAPADGLRFPSAWCAVPGPAVPSLTLGVVQDARMRHGDTDAHGDRQGGEAALRLPSAALALHADAPAGAFLLAVRSSVDTGQAARRGPGRERWQRDQVPATVTLGFEGEGLSAYLVGGTVNARPAVRGWNGLKLWEHSLTGPRANRTSPLTSGERLLVGAQARSDAGSALGGLGSGRVRLMATAFGQATTVKGEAGAALHLAYGDWDAAPLLPVSDLPLPALSGTGAWVGVEGSATGWEDLTRLAGTQPLRASLVAGVSARLGDDLPTLSLTARRMLTEQARGAGHEAVGEYRAGLTLPLGSFLD